MLTHWTNQENYNKVLEFTKNLKKICSKDWDKATEDMK